MKKISILISLVFLAIVACLSIVLLITSLLDMITKMEGLYAIGLLLLITICFVIVVLFNRYSSQLLKKQKKYIDDVINDMKQKGVWNIIIKFVERHQEEISYEDFMGHKQRIEFINQTARNTYKEELKVLKNLLRKKNIDVSNEDADVYIKNDILEEIFSIVIKTLKKEKFAKDYIIYKKTILSEKPENTDDYFYAHLKYYGEDYAKIPYIDFLTNMLNEIYPKIEFKIKSKLDSIREEIKIQRLETSLLNGDTEEEDIDSMEGFEFQCYIEKIFKKLHYKIIHNKPNNEHGADLLVERFDEKTAIQTKRNTDPTGPTAIREAHAGKGYYQADNAIAITSSKFTKSAIDEAKKHGVELWDRKKLDDVVSNL